MSVVTNVVLGKANLFLFCLTCRSCVKQQLFAGRGSGGTALAVGRAACHEQRGPACVTRHEAVATRRRAVARHGRRYHERRAVLVPAPVAGVSWKRP